MNARTRTTVLTALETAGFRTTQCPTVLAALINDTKIVDQATLEAELVNRKVPAAAAATCAAALWPHFTPERDELALFEEKFGFHNGDAEAHKGLFDGVIANIDSHRSAPDAHAKLFNGIRENVNTARLLAWLGIILGAVALVVMFFWVGSVSDKVNAKVDQEVFDKLAKNVGNIVELDKKQNEKLDAMAGAIEDLKGANKSQDKDIDSLNGRLNQTERDIVGLGMNKADAEELARVKAALAAEKKARQTAELEQSQRDGGQTVAIENLGTKLQGHIDTVDAHAAPDTDGDGSTDTDAGSTDTDGDGSTDTDGDGSTGCPDTGCPDAAPAPADGN